MPRYYCEYCDAYLTHDSPSVRKQHNAGYKHKANVRSYYQRFEEQQTQTLIDQKIKEHLGLAAYQQIGAVYNQHLAAFPGQLPRLPIIPPPILPVPGAMSPQMVPYMRPLVLPMPLPGTQGYGAAPILTPSSRHPTGASSMPMNPSGLPIPRPVTTSVPAPTGVPPPSGGAPSA